MNIAIVIGSHRKDSQSAKIGRFLGTLLAGIDSIKTCTIDLGKTPLPLWDEEIGSNAKHWAPLSDIKCSLAKAHGFVFIAPEWHGMVPAGLKNFFLLCSGSEELAHKPALACAVSSGIGGAYVISELRMSSYKNSRICWLPEHLIARDAGQICNNNPTLNDEVMHSAFDSRCQYALKLLVSYARALSVVRESGLIDHETYRNGM